MKPKLLILVLIVAAGIAVTMVAAAIGGQREGREVKGVYETKNDKDRRMTLPKRAKLEKEKGKQHLSVPMNSGDYVGAESIQQAGNLYTAVIA